MSRVAAEATDGRRHGASDWVEAVPATLLREDPWLTLAAARHNVAAGRLDAAVELYTQAERGFGALHAGEKCREERAAVTAWVEPASEIPEGWIGTLRRVARDGTESVRPGLESLPWPGQGVVGAVCAALEGDFDRAVILLTAAADDPSASPALEAATRLAAGVVDAVAGRSDVLARLIAAQEAAERLQLPWLSHLGHVAIVAASQGVDGGAVRRLGTSRPTDPWPAALDELLDALWVPQGERRSSALEGAAARLEALGVPALAEWVITRECTPVRVPSPRVVVRCFGEFSLSVRGRPVSFTELRPRARALLRLLAVNAGRRLHREALLDALWPESDLAAGTRSLQVAVSSVRMLLDPIVGAQRSSIERDGEAYRLALPADLEIDVVRFETLLGEAQAAAARHDHTSERRALEAALDTYSGDLLAADGPSEWAIKERDRLRILAADTAYYLAAGHLEQDEPHAAMSAAQRGIAIDKYRDGLWRILISAQERQGDVAAAARSCRAYDAMLGELGLGSADMSA